jgi:sigma-E factor negative regulatory protein RseC
MVERGLVSEIRGGRLIVKIKRHPACGACKACDTGESREMILELENSIGAESGEEVNIELDDSMILKSAALFYALPLCGLLIGLLAGKALASHPKIGIAPEITAAIAGVILMTGAFLLVGRYNARNKDRYKPKVTKI